MLCVHFIVHNLFLSILDFLKCPLTLYYFAVGKLGCHRDLHANIGKGEIGVAAFKRLMNDARFDDIPMILETPQEDYSKEIKLLNTLMD